MGNERDIRKNGDVGRRKAADIMVRMADRGIIRVGTPKSRGEAIPPAETLILEEWLATGKDPRLDPGSRFYQYDFRDQGKAFKTGMEEQDL